MLPYKHKEDGKKLEKLLEKLFEDDDKPTSVGVTVLREPTSPLPFYNCCNYNYGSYSEPLPMV